MRSLSGRVCQARWTDRLTWPTQAKALLTSRVNIMATTSAPTTSTIHTVRSLIHLRADLSLATADSATQDHYYDNQTRKQHGIVEIKPDDDPVHQKYIRAAAEGHSLEGIQSLLDRGADPNARDAHDFTALHHAAFNQHDRTVAALLSTGSIVNAHHDVYGTPLCLAAIKGDLRIASMLLEFGASVTGAAGYLGSVMNSACFGGDLGVIDAVTARGGSLTAQTISCSEIWWALDLRRSSLLSQMPVFCVDSNATGLGQKSVLVAEITGGDAKKTNYVQSSSLYPAIAGGHLQSLRKCLENGVSASEEIIRWHGAPIVLSIPVQGFDRRIIERPILRAAYCCRPELLRALLENGADPYTCSSDNANALHYLAWSECKHNACESRPLIAKFTNERTLAQRLKSSSAMTPLFSAVSSGTAALVKDLIALGAADFDQPRGDDGPFQGMTPLHWAAFKGDLDVVRVLVDHGANLRYSDPFLGAALHHAASGGKTETVRFLLDKGAAVNGRGGDSNETPLHQASRGRHREIVEILLNHGADPNARNSWGGSAAYVAKDDECRDLIRKKSGPFRSWLDRVW